MDIRQSDNKLTIFLEGRIDSNNAAEHEKRAVEAVLKASVSELVIDADLLEYISSAGLRMLMKLRKMSGRPLPIINVSSDVYDIFEVTGFSELFNIKKKLREISIDGADLIGKGGNGAVYRLDKETIVKVYYGISNPLDKIERDREVSRAVFVQGINTAIPYDVVKVGGDYGVVFEMVEADTLGRFIAEHPDQLETYTHRMTQLLKQLHSTEFEKGKLPDARNIIYHKIDICEKRGLFTAQEIGMMRSFTDSIPQRDTFVHGDFHPGNIMVMDDELILIDVGDSGVGHPVNDLMGMYLMYVVAANAGSSKQYCGLDKEELTRMWPIILRDYFETDDPTPYAQAIAGTATLKLLLGIGVNPNVSEEMRVASIQKIKGNFFDNIDKLIIVPE